MPEINAEGSLDPSDFLAIEQMQAISQSLRFSLPVSSLLSLTTAAITWNDVDRTVLIVWLVAIQLVNIVRFIIPLPNREMSQAGARRVLRHHGLAAFMAGIIWAFVPAHMMSMTGPHAPPLLFILCGLTSGATIHARSFSLIATVFVTPILGVIILGLVEAGNSELLLLGLDTALFLVFLIHSAKRCEDGFVRTVRLKLDATALAESLAREHVASKEAAARLYELANHGSLTGLANRAAFSNMLNAWLEGGAKRRGSFHMLLGGTV